MHASPSTERRLGLLIPIFYTEKDEGQGRAEISPSIVYHSIFCPDWNPRGSAKRAWICDEIGNRTVVKKNTKITAKGQTIRKFELTVHSTISK